MNSDDLIDRAEHFEWLGRIATFEASRSEECDHEYLREAKAHYDRADSLRARALTVS